MSNFCAIKQISARNVGYTIEIMEWSNKMDLIAVSNDKGDVIVYRLNWQKIWTHPPPQDNIKVRSIAWRPNEKIIVIGYSSGDIVLLDVENKEEIYSFSLNNDITKMSWTQNYKEMNLNYNENRRNVLNNHLAFLPALSNLNSLSSTPRKTDYLALKSCTKYILNLLIVCLENGCIHLSVFGVLPCGFIDLSKHLSIPSSDIQILDAKLSFNFKNLYVIANIQNEIQMISFENPILYQYSEPLLNMAIKHFHIINTMTYINDTIQSIIEAWEAVLLEMDNKLTKYAESQPDHKVSADFLELLMFGYPSSALEIFLTRDLTEKGLKKLGNSIELSYSSIQKLVVKHLHSAILHVCYHLNCVKGMSKNYYYYEPILGEISNDAMQSAGSFLIKTSELQQTIDQSTRDYKIFFHWLYVTIIRLMDETVPDDIATVSQQQINYLAEFLFNFDKGPCDITCNNRRFNLERVGQYLEDKNLIIPIQIDAKQHWNNLMEENNCLADCKYIYKHNKNLSLVQEHKQLKTHIEELFKNPEKIIGKNFKLNFIMKLIDKHNMNLNTVNYISFINQEICNCDLFVIKESNTTVILIEIGNGHIKTLKMQFQQKQFFDNKFSMYGDLTYRHFQFYNENILSLLLDSNLNGKKSSVFVQFPLSVVKNLGLEINNIDECNLYDLNKITRIINMYDTLDPSWIRNIDNLDAHLISVSGNRKVASILSESFKRIRFYEMEAEEEEEENDLSQNNSLDNSKDSTV